MLMVLPTIPFYYTAFEIGIYILWGVCAYHSQRRRSITLLLLLLGTLHGIITEVVAITALNIYSYGEFWAMLTIGGLTQELCNGWAPRPVQVPLCVPMMEGVIIYTATQTVGKMQQSKWISVLIVALFILTVDLVIDPVYSSTISCDMKSGTGFDFWSWRDSGREKLWLGVNISNYPGWLLSGLAFSGAWHVAIFLTKKNMLLRLRDLHIILIVIMLAELGLWPLVYLYHVLIKGIFEGNHTILFFTLITAMMIPIVLYRRDMPHIQRIDWVLLAVPSFLAMYALFGLLFKGTYQTGTYVLWVTANTICLLGYTLPYGIVPSVMKQIGAAVRGVLRLPGRSTT